MCPDLGKDNTNFWVQGKYTDQTFRQSFSVEINACNPQLRSTCKNENEIRRFVESFYFTLYILKPKLMFAPDNLQDNPLSTEQEFFGQFALNYDGYRDNNNLIEVHSVNTFDDRLLTTQ